MAHVEKNLCPKIKIEHFQANRARKMMLKQYLADPEAFELSARYDSMFAKVPLVEPSLIDEEVSNAVEALSLAPVASLTQGPDADQDEQEGGSDAETSKSWTRERDAPRSGPFGLPLPDLNKVAPPQNPDSSAPAVSFNRGAIAEPNVDPLDPRSRRFAPQMYKHPLTGKYMCPRAFCGYGPYTHCCLPGNLLTHCRPDRASRASKVSRTTCFLRLRIPKTASCTILLAFGPCSHYHVTS